MKCPLCGGDDVREFPKLYKCLNCFQLVIYREIHGKQITPEIVDELLSAGKTQVFHDFISHQKNTKYSAALALVNGKVVLEFPKRNGSPKPDPQPQIKPGPISVRMESGTSGAVCISVDGPVTMSVFVSYGLVPSRMAEILGLITAAKFIKHYIQEPSSCSLDISFNNVDAARYVLKEQTPRVSEDRKTIEHLWATLKCFESWHAAYQKQKRFKLEGSPQSDVFPKGIFPWIKAETGKTDGGFLVKLPESPDVLAQFKASLRNLEPREGCEFFVPAKSEPALKAWFASVKETDKGGPVNGQ